MTEQQMIDYLREHGYEVYTKEEDEERESNFVHLSEDYKQNVIEKCKLRKELKEIKGKIESGQVVILPCKVGDMVYWFTGLDIWERTVQGFMSDGDGLGWRLCLEDFTPTINNDRLFYTRAEAEAKLKELRDER